MTKRNPNKLATMRRAGKILGEALEHTLAAVKPGITEIELDRIAESYIRKHGGEPGFQKVPGYRHTICASYNDVVVHGIPTKRKLQAGDIIGIDCGVYLEGYHTDMAQTVLVGGNGNNIPQKAKIEAFLRAGEAAMWAGIKQAKAGNHVGDISRAMQKEIETPGYSVVRNLVGHGVGEELHEDPEIPGYLVGKIEKTPLLHADKTIAIEIIYNMGQKDIVYEGTDDWTIVTQDGSLSGLFERSLIVTPEGPELLCRLSYDPM